MGTVIAIRRSGKVQSNEPGAKPINSPINSPIDKPTKKPHQKACSTSKKPGQPSRTRKPRGTQLGPVEALMAAPRPPHLEELHGYCKRIDFPAEQYIDQEFGIAALDRDGHELLKRMFNFFGVVDLDPSDPDFDTVLNTWFELCATVGSDIRGRELFEDVVYAWNSQKWSPEYFAYFEALWTGDALGVRRGAKALRITRGIPEGAPSIRNGPLPG